MLPQTCYRSYKSEELQATWRRACVLSREEGRCESHSNEKRTSPLIIKKGILIMFLSFKVHQDDFVL